MSGFENQTYTQIPNSLFKTMGEMDECELKVVLLICRYTFGYHRDEIKISTRKLAREIRMSVASVCKGAEAAEKRGLIERITEGQSTTLWRALVDVSENETPESPGVSDSSTPLIQNLIHPDSNSDTQVGVKESKKKSKKIKEGKPAEPKASNIPELVIFRAVVGHWPKRNQWQTIRDAFPKIAQRLGRDVTADDLSPWWLAWGKVSGNDWSLTFLDWAIAGAVLPFGSRPGATPPAVPAPVYSQADRELGELLRQQRLSS